MDKGGRRMKTYEFRIRMIGQGEDEHEAWEDAVCYAWENIKDFIRTPNTYEEIKEEEE
tara:strand:+ start:147 stop:320 length:174 start_codon:yes stop_codon:yes gene_type:complete